MTCHRSASFHWTPMTTGLPFCRRSSSWSGERGPVCTKSVFSHYSRESFMVFFHAASLPQLSQLGFPPPLQQGDLWLSLGNCCATTSHSILHLFLFTSLLSWPSNLSYYFYTSATAVDQHQSKHNCLHPGKSFVKSFLHIELFLLLNTFILLSFYRKWFDFPYFSFNSFHWWL